MTHRRMASRMVTITTTDTGKISLIASKHRPAPRDDEKAVDISASNDDD